MSCTSQALVAHSYTFLYVMYTFCIRSGLFSKELVRELYVPIRSVRPSREYRELLYVPIRSLYVPYTFRLVFAKNLSGSYTFLYAPRYPSRNSRKLCRKVIRSYTCGEISNDVPAGNLQYVSRSYTFLYVPSQLCS